VLLLCALATLMTEGLSQETDLVSHLYQQSPREGVLYAVSHPDGTGAYDHSTLSAIRLDGSQAALWNGGTVVIRDPDGGTNLVARRRGTRVIADGTAGSVSASSLWSSYDVLVQSMLLASVHDDVLSAEEVPHGEASGPDVSRRAIKFVDVGMRHARHYLLAVDAGAPYERRSLMQIDASGRTWEWRIERDAADPVWMSYRVIDGFKTEVFYDPSVTELTTQWLLDMEVKHRLRVSPGHVESGRITPLWHEASAGQNPEPGLMPDGTRQGDGGQTREAIRPGESPPPERFNDGWRPTEGDAVTPGVPAGSGLQRWLIIGSGAALVAVGVGFIVVRRVRG